MAAVQTGDTLITADASDAILFWKCGSGLPAISPAPKADAQENIPVNLPAADPVGQAHPGVLLGYTVTGLQHREHRSF